MGYSIQQLDPEKIKEAQIEFDRWWTQRGDNFTSQLFALIVKADPINEQKIAAGFPHEVYVVAKYLEKPILRRFIEGEDGQIIYI